MRQNSTEKLHAMRAILNNFGIDWVHTPEQDRKAGCMRVKNRMKDLTWERWVWFNRCIEMENLLLKYLTNLQQLTILQAFFFFIWHNQIQRKRKALLLASMVRTTVSRIGEAFTLHVLNNPVKSANGTMLPELRQMLKGYNVGDSQQNSKLLYHW